MRFELPAPPESEVRRGRPIRFRPGGPLQPQVASQEDLADVFAAVLRGAEQPTGTQTGLSPCDDPPEVGGRDLSHEGIEFQRGRVDQPDELVRTLAMDPEDRLPIALECPIERGAEEEALRVKRMGDQDRDRVACRGRPPVEGIGAETVHRVAHLAMSVMEQLQDGSADDIDKIGAVSFRSKCG